MEFDTETIATTRRTLEAEWRVTEVPNPERSPNAVLPWLPAEVPGHVHLDLMRAGVIPDPFIRLNERGVQWIDETDWVYEAAFHLDEPLAATAYLLFKGLDTVAEITLNGAIIGTSDNMLIEHEFPVGQYLRAGDGPEGDNTLRILFRSALKVGRERWHEWTDAGGDSMNYHYNYWGARSFVRKAQYMYGWDWGPELLSCGIWQPVELVAVPVARILDWKYDVAFDGGHTAIVTVTAFVERAAGSADTPITFTAALTHVGSDAEEFEDTLPDLVSIAVPAGAGRIAASATITVDNPRLWWPNRHNAAGASFHPSLYTLEMTLNGAEILDGNTARIGLRTIEVIQTPDPDNAGATFKFRINGEDIFIKGANWIPADSFPSRLLHQSGHSDQIPLDADSRIYESIWSSCDAGFNMLRVWGGGLYESDHFYELCDSHGILVWQDFPYACAYYPDTGPYAAAAHAEAVAAVRRLRTHPSLALWCGNNENQTMHSDKWASKNTPSRHIGANLYDDVLPSVVSAEDPATPYIAGSPIGGESPNSPDYGDRHNWDVWHGIGDWVHYVEDTARFVSEFGFSASCGLTAWNSCLDESDKFPLSAAVRWHDKTRKGYETYLGYIALHYPAPKTLEDLVYYSQLNQADALKHAIEHYRRNKGRNWGTLIWQLNDCWPVQSWSMIDAAGEPKASYYASKRFYAPLLLSLVRKENTVEAHLVNDRLAPVAGKVVLTIGTFDGEVLASASSEAEVGANGAAVAAAISLDPAKGRERDVFVRAEFEPGDCSEPAENVLLLAEPKDLRLANPGLTLDAYDEDSETFAVTITAERFAPSVWLSVESSQTWGDRAEWDDNFFSLMPGEARTILVSKTEEIRNAPDLLGRIRIRTL